MIPTPSAINDQKCLFRSLRVKIFGGNGDVTQPNFHYRNRCKY